MYVRVTVNTWNVVDEDELQGVMEKTREEALPLLRHQPGFVGYKSTATDNQTTVTVTRWESEDDAVTGHQFLTDWVRSTGLAEQQTESADVYQGHVSRN